MGRHVRAHGEARHTPQKSQCVVGGGHNLTHYLKPSNSNPQAFISNSHQQYNMSHVRTVLGVVPRAGRLVPLSILMLLSHQNLSFILSLDPPFSQGIIDATITCPHYYRITISIH